MPSVFSPQSNLKGFLINYGFGKKLLESGVLFLRRLQSLNLGHLHTAILLPLDVEGSVGTTLLHGDVLMWLMKTLLTLWCINQRGKG